MKPRVLDLFCCQGAAARGYERAGMAVVRGVDVSPQPRYPYPFTQADAIPYVLDMALEVDFVHASPPCQHDSDCQRIQGNDHPDLIGPTREALDRAGLPYVIENVGGAETKLKNPVELCGAMFGLHTYRHRYFECGGGFSFEPPEHPPHLKNTVKMGRPLKPGDFYHAVGHFSGVPYVREDMGVHWMNRDGISECVPPAYTEYIGRRLISHLKEAA